MSETGATNEYQARAFSCALCGVYASHSWSTLNYWNDEWGQNVDMPDWRRSECSACESQTIWLAGKRVYPISASGPAPNPDMPDDVRVDFEEARQIRDLSPRGAAALLRLCIQKLCIHLGQPGKKLNDDIGALVRNGLDPRIQQALDVVRVIGNNAVHPGEIDLRDDLEQVDSLFRLVNLIIDDLISRPKHIEDQYQALPEAIRNSIEKRDRKTREQSQESGD